MIIGSLLKRNKPFVILLIITGIFSLGAFNFSFILLKASDLGVGQSVVPLVYTTINISHTIIGIPVGILADKIGKEKVILIGYAVFALSSILMGLFTNNYLYAYFLALIFGSYMGISDTVQRAVILKYIPAELRGTAYGVYNLITGVCFFISNVIFGYIWDNYNLNLATLYSLFFSLFAIGGMIIFIKKYSTIPFSSPNNR